MMIRVFILGGNRQGYLMTQVEMFREHTVDLERIIWVTGPLSHNPDHGHSRTHVAPVVDIPHLAMPEHLVRPRTKLPRLRDLQTVLVEHFSGGHDCLVVHADLFPVATVDAEIIKRGNNAAWLPGFGACWMMSNRFVGGDLTREGVVATPWMPKFIRIGEFDALMCPPCFVHLDDVSKDNWPRMKSKLEAFKQWLKNAEAAVAV